MYLFKNADIHAGIQHWKNAKKFVNRILLGEVGTLLDFPDFFVLYFVDLLFLQHFLSC